RSRAPARNARPSSSMCRLVVQALPQSERRLLRGDRRCSEPRPSATERSRRTGRECSQKAWFLEEPAYAFPILGWPLTLRSRPAGRLHSIVSWSDFSTGPPALPLALDEIVFARWPFLQL